MSRVEISTDKGVPVMMMGCPMGPADFSAEDFQAFRPSDTEKKTPVLFGIDPDDMVELTVVNEFGQEVTHTFQPGAQPYLLRKIKKDANVTVQVNYFI